VETVLVAGALEGEMPRLARSVSARGGRDLAIAGDHVGNDKAAHEQGQHQRQGQGELHHGHAAAVPDQALQHVWATPVLGSVGQRYCSTVKV
jgi:hypothetical protein